jgi:hypothetical protein
MKPTASIFVLATLLLGCSNSDPHLPGYKVASGDLTPFILQSAISGGARPSKTTGFSSLEAEWRYRTDKDGIQIYLVGDRFSEVQALLAGAFGPPAIAPKTNENGRVSMGVYAAPAVGAAIQFSLEDFPDGTRYTKVLVVRGKAFQP